MYYSLFYNLHTYTYMRVDGNFSVFFGHCCSMLIIKYNLLHVHSMYKWIRNGTLLQPFYYINVQIKSVCSSNLRPYAEICGLRLNQTKEIESERNYTHKWNIVLIYLNKSNEKSWFISLKSFNLLNGKTV